MLLTMVETRKASGAAECREVLKLLASPDLRTSEQAEQTLKTQLATSGEWYGPVMEAYVQRGSHKLCELLAGVREPQDVAFLDALTHAFRNEDTRQPALALLSRVVQQQASWIPKLPQHRIFTDILKMLKSTKKPVEVPSFPLLSVVSCGECDGGWELQVVAGLFFLAAVLPHSRIFSADFLRELLTVMLKTAFYLYRLTRWPLVFGNCEVR